MKTGVAYRQTTNIVTYSQGLPKKKSYGSSTSQGPAYYYNDNLEHFSIQGVITDSDPGATEFVDETYESDIFTPIVTQSTMSDPTWIKWYSQSGSLWGAYWLPWGIGSEPSELSDADTVVQVDMNSDTYGDFEIRTVTINNDEQIDNGEMFRLYHPGGNIVVWFNTAGSPRDIPTGSVYTGATTTIEVDISSIGSGSPVTNVAEAVEAACEANSAFNTYFTVDNTAGVLTFTNKHIGNATATAVYDADSTSLSPFGSPETYAFETTTTQAGSVADTVDAVIDSFIAAVNDSLGGSPNEYFTITANAGAGSPNQAESFTITNKVAGLTSDATSSGSPQAFTITESVDAVGGADVVTNYIYSADHGFSTGTVGQLTTTDTLPTGLATSTDYYIIKVDDDNFQLASSLANAQAGTAIDITAAGAGTHTFTATSLDITATLQYSNDNSNWVDTTQTQAIDSPANNADDFMFAVDRPSSLYYRVYYTYTAGEISVTQTFVGTK